MLMDFIGAFVGVGIIIIGAGCALAFRDPR
jgi:hypothetical protein